LLSGLRRTRYVSSDPAPRAGRTTVQRAALAVGIVFLAVLGTPAEFTAQRVGG